MRGKGQCQPQLQSLCFVKGGCTSRKSNGTSLSLWANEERGRCKQLARLTSIVSATTSGPLVSARTGSWVQSRLLGEPSSFVCSVDTRGLTWGDLTLTAQAGEARNRKRLLLGKPWHAPPPTPPLHRRRRVRATRPLWLPRPEMLGRNSLTQKWPKIWFGVLLRGGR